jgi:ABC-type branched-subunit amino acid transport system substrate-binding protein
MNKKIIWAIVVIVVLLAGIYSVRPVSEKTFTIGAVLPMTGPAALWGETVKNGMDLALESKTDIRVLYEDSRSTAADGVTAYNLLKSKGVDLYFSELSLVATTFKISFGK